MLTQDIVLFLQGVVSDSEYPYYLIYPESFGSNNDTIHIFLSKEPIEVIDNQFIIKDVNYLIMTHNAYIKPSNEYQGDITYTIPVADTLAYTSTQDTPLYPNIYQSANVTNTNIVDFNYPFLLLILVLSFLVGNIISSVLGGK